MHWHVKTKDDGKLVSCTACLIHILVAKHCGENWPIYDFFINRIRPISSSSPPFFPGYLNQSEIVLIFNYHPTLVFLLMTPFFLLLFSPSFSFFFYKRELSQVFHSLSLVLCRFVWVWTFHNKTCIYGNRHAKRCVWMTGPRHLTALLNI